MRKRDSAERESLEIAAREMRLCHYIPGAPLSALVHCLWDAEGAPQTHSKEKLLPTGECSIIFNLREEPIRLYDARDITHYATYGAAVLSGPRSDCFVIDTEQQERVMGIQFRAGGVFPFLRMPVCEAEGASIGLEELYTGGRVGEIRERLLAASSVEARFAELERWLLDQLVRPLELHPAVAYAVAQFQQQSAHSARVATVSERIGLSSRRFAELFRQQVGLTPKVFSRVRRFQHVLATIRMEEEIDWAEVALECGYYDQPHFIHDFQSFSGLTPGEYLAAATPHLNHVPLL